MSWIEALWPMTIGSFLTMALVHLWTGLRKPGGRVNVLFAISAIFAATYSWFELEMTRAGSPAEFLARLRWLDLAAGGMAVSLGVFVWDYFGLGRKWLGVIAIGVMLGSLMPDLLPVPQLVYLEITGIHKVTTFGGATYTVGEGVSSPWNLIFYGGVFLLLTFVADASIRLWQRGDRHKALRIGGTVILFFLIGGVQAFMTDLGVLQTPYLVTFCWMAILVVMAWELSNDQLRAEQLVHELREYQERMNLAMKAADLGIWEWDIARDEVRATEAIRMRFGLAEIERPPLERFLRSLHPDDRAGTRMALRRSVDHGNELLVEYRLINTSGKVRWIAARGQVEHGANGKPLRIRGVSVDITERKQAELALSEAGRMAKLGSWEWDVQADRVTWSKQVFHIFGIPAGTVVTYARLMESIHPDDRDYHDRHTQDWLQNKEVSPFQYRVVHPDGSIRHVYATGKVERDAQGNPIRMFGSVQDVTERYQREEAVRESEARFRTMADTAPVMIWMAGTDKLCHYFNKGWLDYTGRSLEQELGNGWAEGIHPDDFQRCLDIYMTSFDARREFSMQYRLRKQDCEYGWVLDNGVPRFAADGQFLGYIGTCIDITYQKEAEELHRDLAHIQRVSATGQLATTLAHELSQPLGAILRNAEAAELFLQQDPPDLEELQAILADIRKDDQRAGAVIDRMRSLIKRRDPEFEPLGLKEIVDQVAVLVLAEIKMHHTTFEIDVPDSLSPVKGDRVQLQQVLLNLLLNSLDALEDLPSERRRLSLTAHAAGAQTVVVAVSDCGRGIPADKLSDIFKPFSTTKPKGLGMGLVISQAIIAAHGGRLWAENNPAGGATFRFTLKVAPPETIA